jgi:hypothetical protein
MKNALMENRDTPIVFKHYAGMSDLRVPLALSESKATTSGLKSRCFASDLTPPDISDKMIVLSRNWSFKPYEYTTMLRRHVVFTDLLFREGINFPVFETKLNWGINMTKDEAIDIFEPTDKTNCPMRNKLRLMAQQCWQTITPEIAFGDVLPLIGYDRSNGSITNYLSSQFPLSEQSKYVKYCDDEETKNTCFYGYNGWAHDIRSHPDGTEFSAELVQINYGTYNCFRWFIHQAITHDSKGTYNNSFTKIYEMPEKKLVARYISAKVMAVGYTEEYNELIKYIAETYGICGNGKHKKLGNYFEFNGKQYKVKKI